MTNKFIRLALVLLAIQSSACGGNVDGAALDPVEPCSISESASEPEKTACPSGYASYVLQCVVPVENPVGLRCIPKPNYKGIEEEVGGKANDWCCAQ